MSQEIENEETSVRHTTPAKMTYEEFLARADEDVPAEWVDGEVILMSPASSGHQDKAEYRSQERRR